MSEHRSSRKGRGAEVLLGQPQAVRIEHGTGGDETAAAVSLPSSLPVEPAAALPPSTALQPADLWATDLERAMFEEARAAESPGQEGAYTVPAGRTPALPDQTTIAAGEETMQPTAVSGDVLGTVAGLAQEVVESQAKAVGDIQTPDEPVEPLELPERPLTEEQRTEIIASASARLRELDEEISKAYDQVLNDVGESNEIATACQNQLLKARDIVLRREVGQLAQAEFYVEQVLARLRRAAASRRGARRNAWWITIWGFLWAVAYIGALILLDSEWVEEAVALLRIESTYVEPKVFLSAMVWGGVGGVVAIWYSLFKHVSQRDFDSHYNITYVGKPFFGLILGATVYMVIHLVIVSLGIWPAEAGGVAGMVTPTLAPWVIYLLAWASGFKENRIFGVVDAVMKRVFSGGQSTTTV